MNCTVAALCVKKNAELHKDRYIRYGTFKVFVKLLGTVMRSNEQCRSILWHFAALAKIKNEYMESSPMIYVEEESSSAQTPRRNADIQLMFLSVKRLNSIR